MNTPRMSLGFVVFGWLIGELGLVFHERFPDRASNHHWNVLLVNILTGRGDNIDDAPREKGCCVAAIYWCGEGCLVVGNKIRDDFSLFGCHMRNVFDDLLLIPMTIYPILQSDLNWEKFTAALAMLASERLPHTRSPRAASWIIQGSRGGSHPVRPAKRKRPKATARALVCQPLALRISSHFGSGVIGLDRRPLRALALTEQSLPSAARLADTVTATVRMNAGSAPLVHDDASALLGHLLSEIANDPQAHIHIGNCSIEVR